MTKEEKTPLLAGETDIVALLEAAAALSNKADVVEAAREGARQVLKILDAHGCLISQWDREANAITLLWKESREKAKAARESGQPQRLKGRSPRLKVLRTGGHRQYRADDGVDSLAALELLEETAAKALLLTPVLAQEEVIGLMEIYDSRRARTFDAQQVAVAKWLASQVGIAILRSKLLAEERQRTAELEALRQASLSVTASLDLNEVLHAILESTLDLSRDALDAHIFLYDGEKLHFGAALWADRTENKVWSNPRENGLTYRVARGGEMVVIPDSTKHPFYKKKPRTWDDWSGAIIGMPLKIGERVVGVMNIAYDHARGFSGNELRIFRLLGDQAALAIENARLHDLVSQTR
jgi:GAF domain-containing protein